MDQPAYIVLAALLAILAVLVMVATHELIKALPIDREAREVERLERAADPAGDVTVAWLGGLTVRRRP